jgi:hypothetical protein
VVRGGRPSARRLQLGYDQRERGHRRTVPPNRMRGDPAGDRSDNDRRWRGPGGIRSRNFMAGVSREARRREYRCVDMRRRILARYRLARYREAGASSGRSKETQKKSYQAAHDSFNLTAPAKYHESL